MGKGTYRSYEVKSLGGAAILAKTSGADLTVGLDIAKRVQYAALMVPDRTLVTTVRWSHPEETEEVIGRLQSLGCSRIEVTMESSGTYGDSIRERLIEAGIDVYRVSTKRVKDAQEVYDGVPSRHDAKCAAVLAWLHREGMSEKWQRVPDERRDLRALVDGLELYESQLNSHVNRLEALLARYWPEVTSHLDLKRASLLELLKEYGGPSMVGKDQEGARGLLHRVGRVFLKKEKVELVLASAAKTIGVAMRSSEEDLVRQVATEIRRCQRESRAQRQRIKVRVESQSDLETTRLLLGSVTTGVVRCLLGAASEYESAGSYVKAAGLNLKEVSSGQRRGRLSLSKRGSGPLRRWLFLATLRLIKRDQVVKAWYEKKVARDGGVRMKAVVAVMRKLVKALWHVGQGNPFDSRLLFDVSRLDVAT